MKKQITIGVAVATLTMGMASMSHAFWFVNTKVSTSTENATQTAGRDAYGKSTNSFNRTNSHNISRSKNVITGNGGDVTGGKGSGSNGSASAVKSGGGLGWFGYGEGGSGSASASLSNWKNSGTVGNGISGTTITGLTAGDTVSTGNTYINSGDNAVSQNAETERARIKAGQ